MVYRVYVEKKPGQTHEADSLFKEVQDFLQISGLSAVQVLNRYDVENIDAKLFDYAVGTVFSEPQVDNVTFTVPEGQVVLGSVPKKIKQPTSQLYQTVSSLKVITKLVKYARIKEEDSGPSCSLAEALEKQDLFINSTLAQLGCNILWKMFRHGMIEHHGLYLNLSTMKVNPIMV